MQYSLAGGQRVDAIVRLADRILPIDSKFPIEPFQRDEAHPGDEPTARETTKALKKYVESIAAKYIRPEEGTTDVAVMYIPSEAVYYRFISQPDNEGLTFALSHNVIPSSPGHLYAFLASLAAVYTQAGLTGSNRELVAAVRSLSEGMEKLRDWHSRMEGSTRRLSTSLTRANEVVSGMSQRLQVLQEPTAESEQPDSPTDDNGH
jgi:DNA recombination protein RmuC